MNLLENLKRVGFDVVALVSIFVLAFFIPDTYLPEMAKMNLLTLFLTKFVLVSAAVAHAHITRKLLFPYIKFASEKDWSNNAMIIVWYVIIIFGWTRGG